MKTFVRIAALAVCLMPILLLAQGTITSFSDGLPANQLATAAGLGDPEGVATDSLGNIYIANVDDSRVYKVDPSGVLTIVAGTGVCTFGGDGGPARDASLCGPTGVAVDPAGSTVWIADYYNNRVRKVDSTGTITTVAGNGVCCSVNDGGPAIAAWLSNPVSVALDNSGNLFIADYQNNRIRKVDSSGIITTFAGNGTSSCYDTGTGPATQHGLCSPWGLTVDSSGNIYATSSRDDYLREIDSGGNITVVFSSGGYGVAIDLGGNILSAVPFGVIIGASIVYDAQVLQLNGSGTVLSVVAGVEGANGFNGDGNATTHDLYYPYDVAIDGSGDVFIADRSNQRIRKVDTSSNMTTVAGNGNADTLRIAPNAAVADSLGNVYFSNKNYVEEISSDGSTVTIVAGNGNSGFSGDGPATQNSLYSPFKLAFDSSGNLYIADTSNQRIRKVDTAGNMTTVAGNGGAGFSGDGPATSNSLNYPYGVAADANGNIYIADTNNSRIRKVDSSGNMTTVAGVGAPGFSGDGGAATSAALRNPESVAVDPGGNIYIADVGNNRIRKVDTQGRISTVVGTGACYLSNDGPGISVALCNPEDVAAIGSGVVAITDTNNNRILFLYPSGDAATVAGDGGYGFSGDGGSALIANLAQPTGAGADNAGDLFIADNNNFRIREVTGAPLIEPAADLAIVKTPGSTTVDPGTNITYTITVTNNGPQSASSVVVSDVLPGGTTFVSCNASGGGTCTGSGSNQSVTFTSLANGEVETITLVVSTNSSLPDGTVILNTASISSAVHDTNSGNNSSTAAVTVTRRADLNITSNVAPSPVDAGTNLTYTLVVTNNGPDSATSTVVSDSVPPVLTLVSCSSTAGGVCGGSGNNLTITFSSLPSSGSATITLVATVDPNATDNSMIGNTATVTSSVTDPNPADNASFTSVLVVNRADLGIRKSGSTRTISGGTELTYTLVVRNGGPLTSNGVVVTDPLPTNVVFHSVRETQGSCSTPPVGSNGTITCNLGSIANGGSARISIVAMKSASTQGTSVTNTATVTAATYDPSQRNNSSSVTNTVAGH